MDQNDAGSPAGFCRKCGATLFGFGGYCSCGADRSALHEHHKPYEPPKIEIPKFKPWEESKGWGGDGGNGGLG